MKRLTLYFAGVTCLAAVLAWTFASQGALPPLKVNRNAPRLESGPPPPQSLPHSMCLDCHRNYNWDPFAVAHAAHKIQCVDCHGDSIAHKEDEANITPPDKMYARGVITAKCLECHSLRQKAAPEVIERKRNGQMVQVERRDITCMDCHGENHLMRLRAVIWDKETGKLLSKSNEPSSEARRQEVKE